MQDISLFNYALHGYAVLAVSTWSDFSGSSPGNPSILFLLKGNYMKSVPLATGVFQRKKPVVFKQSVRYNMDMVRCLFVNGYITHKKGEDCEHRIEKCSDGNRQGCAV